MKKKFARLTEKNKAYWREAISTVQQAHKELDEAHAKLYALCDDMLKRYPSLLRADCRRYAFERHFANLLYWFCYLDYESSPGDLDRVVDLPADVKAVLYGAAEK